MPPRLSDRPLVIIEVVGYSPISLAMIDFMTSLVPP